MSFAAIPLFVASQRVFIVISVYFVMGSVRKLLDAPKYIEFSGENLGFILVSRICYGFLARRC
jgi:hypothetical protein